VLLISNKMNVVEKADHIVFLKEGMLMEEGSHEELLQKGGHYAAMVNKQRTGFRRQEEETEDTR